MLTSKLFIVCLKRINKKQPDVLTKMYEIVETQTNFNIVQFQKDHTELVDQTAFLPIDNEKLKTNCSANFCSLIHKHDTCIICLGDFEESVQVMILPICGHLYHEACLNPWLLQQNKCPICKAGVRLNLLMQIQNRIKTDDINKKKDLNDKSIGDLNRRDSIDSLRLTLDEGSMSHRNSCL